MSDGEYDRRPVRGSGNPALTARRCSIMSDVVVMASTNLICRPAATKKSALAADLANL